MDNKTLDKKIMNMCVFIHAIQQQPCANYYCKLPVQVKTITKKGHNTKPLLKRTWGERYSVDCNIVEVGGQRLANLGGDRDSRQGVVGMVYAHLQWCPSL